ncbi:MAG: hypothetical protein ACREYE_30295, partial [Gammaproteobacteria bacterium]
MGLLTVVESPRVPFRHAPGMSLNAPTEPRLLLALSLIAPLALFMGMPFPFGMAGLAADGSELMPWAWGING